MNVLCVMESILRAFSERIYSFGLQNAAHSEWYITLKKAPLTPPDWVFRLVWPCLYIGIGLAGYWLYRALRDKKRGYSLLALYGFQLLLNGMWPYLFFKQHNLLAAFVDNLALVLLVAFLAYRGALLDKKITYCLLPYLGWISFAAYMSGYMWCTN